jgi:hypothetical protein
MRRLRLFGILATALLSSPALAAEPKLRSTARAGLGWSSNPGLGYVDPRAEALWLVSGRTQWRVTDSHALSFSLGYLDYLGSRENDVLNAALALAWEADPARDLRFRGGLSVRNYPAGSPGTTDSSFNAQGLELEGEKGLGESWTVLGGYELRRYSGDPSQFDSRVDHTFYAAANWDYLPTPADSLGAGLELGWIPSSLPEYSRVFAELSASYERRLSPAWRFAPALSYRLTSYSSRLTSSTTIFSRRRGATTSTSVNQAEAYGTFHLAAESFYALSPAAELSIAPALTRQASRSGTQDYTAIELITRLSITF